MDVAKLSLFAVNDDLVLTFHGSYLQEPNGNRWIED